MKYSSELKVILDNLMLRRKKAMLFGALLCLVVGFILGFFTGYFIAL